MAFDDNQGGYQRKMYPVDTTCAKCGKHIDEVPFPPDPARVNEILCRDCHREKRQSMRGGRSFGR